MERHSAESCVAGASPVIGMALAKRIPRHGAILFFIITINFLLIHLMPGDPLVHLLGEETYGRLAAQDPDQLEALKARYGIDASLGKQYFNYLSSLAKGDLGWSFQHHRPVLTVLFHHLKWTLLLLAPSLVLSGLAGGLLGLLSGLSSGRNPAERVLTPLLLTLYSVPLYCLAFLLLLSFAFHSGLAPLAGIREPGKTGITGLFSHMLLPSAAIVLHATAYYYVIMSSAVRQVLREAFIYNAFARGFSRRYILFRHVLKNALLPFITVVAMQSGALFGGSLLVEIIFSWQGVGSLIYGAVASRDYPLISGCFLIISICVIAANAAADWLYALIDPRIRDGARSL